MSVKIQIRRGTASEWSTANPTLSAGELGYDTTNDILKVGDGSTAWSSLAEADNQSADQVTYSQTGQTFALGANVQAAIYAIDDELIAQDGRLDTIEADENTVGSIAKALKDAKDYADGVADAQNEADEISYDQTSQTYALGANVQAALYAIDDELIAQDGRLDTIEADENTAGSIAKALKDAKDYADTEIDAAKLALGTNYSVADLTARAALEGLTVGDLIFVTDDGDTKWAQYKVTAITDGDGSTSTFEKIMDEDVYLNAISASAVKTAYESNSDTNAFTDALLSKLNGIETTAKDDQNADEVPYVDTSQTYALGANVQAAIYAIDDELISQDGRLDTIEGDVNTAGSIAKALQDAKDYADTQDALQDAADEISYDQTSQTYALGANVQAAIYAIDDELISQDGRLDTLEVNAISASAIKTAYESNSDTNALTDAGLAILAGDHPANQVFAGPTTGADDAAAFRALVAGDIPSLDAAKITTGTFSDAQIPSLEANKITTGTFDAARIPDLSANKITTDTLGADRIPTLAQSKITNLETDLAAKVVGPASVTANNFATFDGTTGKLVQDSGFSASSFAKISIGSTEPSSPSAGDLWFNNDAAVKNLFFYDGTDWIGVNTYQ